MRDDTAGEKNEKEGFLSTNCHFFVCFFGSLIEISYFCPQVLTWPRSFRGCHYITNVKFNNV